MSIIFKYTDKNLSLEATCFYQKKREMGFLKNIEGVTTPAI